MTLLLKLRCLGFLAMAAFAFVPTGRAETGGDAAPTEHTPEQKALCQALDDQLVRFETLLAKDENTAHATTVKTTLAALKQRRDAFNRIAFDPAKYDELRFDLNVAYQRLNLWLAPPLIPKSAPKAKTADSTKARP